MRPPTKDEIDNLLTLWTSITVGGGFLLGLAAGVGDIGLAFAGLVACSLGLWQIGMWREWLR